jgi:hypothetical protein
MARKSLKPQLNQIRAWARQGRTDAWIAHQLEVSTSQLRDFRKRHGLDEGEEPASDVDLRDEIEAEIEAELDAVVEEDEDDEDEEPEDRDEDGGDRDSDDEAPKPRRRRRRGGRGRGRGRKRDLEATFDHGDKDGYGLWLDPAVKDDPVYSEHWAEQRALKVTIEPERIVLERANGSTDD